MSVPDDLEVYALLSVLERLKAEFPNDTVNFMGTRAKTDGLEQWFDLNLIGDARMRSRRANWMGRMLFQVSCVSRLEEGRENRDAIAPHRLGAAVRKAFEHVDLPVKKIGAGEDIIATLNIREARQSYLPRRNITFQGQGDFSMEQGNTHAVVVDFQATLVV